ncbi:hypothetical protein [Nonomuraea sp. JJY05]|uniref:hypothetical protein n=1 Tax=Nonomuraea sp. JJY05 TaxID=3350255 RepID=UPI00373FAD49
MARTAEDLYTALSPAQRQRLRQVLLRLREGLSKEISASWTRRPPGHRSGGPRAPQDPRGQGRRPGSATCHGARCLCPPVRGSHPTRRPRLALGSHLQVAVTERTVRAGYPQADGAVQCRVQPRAR